ncbi:hypothetical protein ACVBGC_11465 [Burkholderia stagnalis]
MRWNTLDVPLEFDWQCTLVPCCDYRTPSGDAHAFIRNDDERRRLEEDRRDFHRYFRPDWDIRSNTGQAAVLEIQRFLSDRLNIAHWSLPTDIVAIEGALRQAVANERLVPMINRNWRGQPMVFRPTPFPLRWPPSARGPDAGYIVPYGELLATVEGGPGGDASGKIASNMAGGSVLDWLGAAVAVADAALGAGISDKRNLASSGMDGLAEGVPSFGAAVSFEYLPDAPIVDEVLQLAGATGVPGNNQAQNKQFKAVVRVMGLDQRQARLLHEEISGEGLGYHEILERARDMFGGS